MKRGTVVSDHITTRPAIGTWSVRAGGAVIGESKNAIELIEGDLPPVIYFPKSDLAMAVLDQTVHTSICPYKGSATYYSIVTKSQTLANMGWSYETPITGMEAIAGHIAFYTQNQVAVEQI